MTTSQLPGAIRATIHSSAMHRVSGFFNATAADILNELLQNSRRSGATRVEIAWDGKTTTVADNGEGIGNPEVILSFGNSGWENEAARREHPAGMGFYALARSPETAVRSRTPNGQHWEVILNPGHFTGDEPAPVRALPQENGGQTGTEVAFTCSQDPGDTLKQAARHCPLEIIYNGNELPRQDFLGDACHVREWRGIRIGVLKNWAKRDDSPQLNFFGITLNNVKFPDASTLDAYWSARADVQDAEGLELTLPARKELVETEFTEELRKACLVTIYEAISMDPERPDVSKSAQDVARELGIMLPDARPMLSPWSPAVADQFGRPFPGRRQTLPGEPIVMSKEMEAYDEQALARAAERAGLMPRLFNGDERLEGYEWYDRLEKVTGMRINAIYGDREININELRADMKAKPLEDLRPDSIRLTLETASQGGTAKGHAIPADVVFDRENMDFDDAVPLVTKDTSVTVEELTGLIMRSWFAPSDDPEADSYDSQEAYAERVCGDTAAGILLGEDYALTESIREAVRVNIQNRMPKDIVATVKVGFYGKIEVSLERSTPEPEC